MGVPKDVGPREEVCSLVQGGKVQESWSKWWCGREGGGLFVYGVCPL